MHILRKSSQPNLLDRIWISRLKGFVSCIRQSTGTLLRHPCRRNTRLHSTHKQSPMLWTRRWMNDWITCRKRASSNASSIRRWQLQSCLFENQSGGANSLAPHAEPKYKTQLLPPSHAMRILISPWLVVNNLLHGI